MITTVGQNIFNWSGFFVASGLFVAIGLFVWWLIRKRLRDFWLPVVRVFKLPASRLPRIIIQRPPLVPFLLFLICAVLLLIWSLKPSTKILVKDEPGVSRVHVFIDMSPSVSAQVSIGDLSKKFAILLEQIGPKSRVTFGTSHGDNIYEMTSPAEAAGVVSGLGFHRGGAKIGSGVRAQITRVGDVDQLFVISDRDQHSWMGFQWQYLTVDGEVHHVDVDDPGRRATKPNVFIQDARYLSSAGSPTMDWEVEISLGVLTVPVSGTLSAMVGGDVVGVANWEIPAGRRSSVVSVSWPTAKVSGDILDPSVEWLLEVSGGDLLQMDNKFLTPLKGRRDLVVLVGEPSGELRLEDPQVALETALRVSGYAVSRYDRWPQSNPSEKVGEFDGTGTVVLLASDTSNLDLWCPKTLMKANEVTRAGPIWVTPRSLKDSYGPVCRCLANLGARITLDMCDSQMSRADLIELLGAVGARQVGGNIGEASGSMAMMLSASDLPRNVVSFTVPVRPTPEIGLSWGIFPIMVKDLMRFSQGKDLGGGGDGLDAGSAWPRLVDVATAIPADDSMAEQWTQIFRSTNVPVGESLIAVVPTSDLPSSWASTMSLVKGGVRSGRESEDARFWAWVLAGLVVLFMCLETFWFWRLSRNKAAVNSILVLLASAMWMISDQVTAKARLDLLGADGQGVPSFQALSREVASRTSLELSPSPQVFRQFDDASASSPWLWTSKASLMADKNGHITDAGRLWLKRGGMIIFDGPQPTGTLEKLLEPLMSGTVRPTGWMAMPADHEFMRSFYLLNSLPACKGRFWRVFSFDGRVVAIEAPYSNLKLLQDRPVAWTCEGQVSYEQHARIFVNLMMTAFTTDYKRDQIHLPEILKRLRVP
jgi:hypothetical protein